jgi:hypothetical protein
VWRNGVFIEVTAVTPAEFFYKGLIWFFLAAINQAGPNEMFNTCLLTH